MVLNKNREKLTVCLMSWGMESLRFLYYAYIYMPWHLLCAVQKHTFATVLITVLGHDLDNASPLALEFACYLHL